MEENIKIMEQLLSESGKEPNQEQRKMYYRALYQLLIEKGFNDTAQEYMGRGYKFVKMGPFKALFVRQDDSVKEGLLNQLFNSSFFKKDNSRAFNILINLLALFISGKVEYIYCKTIVREIPNYCYNKEGKILGNANGAMMNNFYSDLTSVPNNFEYEKLFDSDEVRVQFEELLANSIAYASAVRKLTARQKDAVEMVKEWIPGAVNQTQMAITEEKSITVENSHKSESSQQTDTISSLKKIVDSALPEHNNCNRNDVTISDSGISEEDQPITERNERLPDGEGFAVNLLPAVLERLLQGTNRLNSAFEKSNENTAALIRNQQAYIDNLKNSIEMEKANSDLIRRRNIELTEATISFQKKIEELNKQLIDKEEEIRSLNALLEVSSIEGDRKFKGEILKLTEKLRFEYQDYMSAKNIAMSIELGENMRDQLGDVFAILKKAGLDIDSN